MDEGDHSRCSVELLPCPEHRGQQLQALTAANTSDLPRDESISQDNMFRDKDGNHIVGFCLWCNSDFYTLDEVWEHNANGMKACPVFQESKDEHCMPPVLQVAFENAGLLNDEKAD
jgi:hypothetical protein